MAAPKSTLTYTRMTSGSSLVIEKPANVTSGDVLTAFIRSQQGGQPDVAPPSGWSRVGPAFDPDSGGRVIGVWAKVAGSSEPADYTFTINSRAVGAMAVWSKNEVALQVTGYTPDYRGVWDTDIAGRTHSSYPISEPSLALVVAGAEMLDGGTHVPWRPPDGYTQIMNIQTGTGTSGSRTCIWVGYREVVTTPVPGFGLGWEWSTAGESVHGVSLKLLDYDLPPPEPANDITSAIIESGSVLEIPHPTAAKSGDVMVAFIRSQTNGGPDVIPPVGWTRVGPAYNPDSGGRVMSCFIKTATSSEPSLHVFSTDSRAIGIIKVYPLADVAPNVRGSVSHYRGIWDVYLGGRKTDEFASTGPIIQFVFLGAEALDGVSAYPSVRPPGFQELAFLQTGTGNEGARTSVWVGTKIRNSPGEPTYMAYSGNTGGDTIQSFALEYKKEVPPPPSSIYTGNRIPGELFIVRSGLSPQRGELRQLRPGFSSVSDMLSTPGFTWAHRGLSTFAEESLYSYTRAVERGHGVLECSLGRTFDGVWVATHDNNLNRVALREDLPPINQMLWSQVQALEINLGEGAPQPFMRVEELISAYGDSHILIFDLKNYSWGEHLTDFLALIAPLPKDRVIFKHIIWETYTAETVRDAGYDHRWGYAYAGTFTEGPVAEWQAPWSLLGMEHVASQSVWDTMLAFGKPVIGHIARTQQHYDTAISKGAAGVQTTGYAVEPVSWWNS